MATNRVPYRTSLRVLGRLLNGDKARMVTLCEIDDGFLLHYFVQGDPYRVNSRAIHSAEALDLDDLLHGQRGKLEPEGSFKGLQSMLGFRQSEALKFQKSHPLCPMGYENVLRALGESLDGRHAQAVLIHELDDSVHVEYTIDRADFVVRDGVRIALPGRREERYTASGIEGLVRKCREQTDEKVRRNGKNLSYNPMDVVAYLDTAQTLDDDGHYRDAEDLFRKAAQLAPAHPEAHYGLARLARRRGDHKAALKSLQSATTLDPANGRYLHLLGRINMERQHFEDAITALRQAARLEPGNRMYLFDLSRAYARLGRHEEAEAVLARSGSGVGAHAVASPPAAPAAPSSSVERRTGGRAHVAHHVEVTDIASGAAVAARSTQGGTAGCQQLEERTEARLPAGWDSFPPADEGARETSDNARVEQARNTSSSGDGVSPDPAVLPSHDAPLPRLATRLARGAAGADGVGPAARGADALLDGPPTLPATATPFAGEAPSWDRAAWPGPIAGQRAPDAAAEAPSLASSAPRGGEALPALGLVNEWAAPTWPAVHVPADATAALASLPLAVPSNVERRTSNVERAAAPMNTGGSDAGGQVARPAPDDDAVQLAAAIMRAEELARAEPHRADLHRKLGFLLAKQGRSEEAAAEFRRAVECGRRRFAE